jgi:GTP-binding protein
MMIHTAEYLLSSPDMKHCPTGNIPEFAFAGRSNVGKSSLINMLTDRKSLAKTSVKPGKTKLLNFFLINDNWRLVDLPGYGYAGVSKELRKTWLEMMGEYLTEREQLANTFVLIDSRIEPQKIDIDFLNWLGDNQVAFSVVFTKTDKIKGVVETININAFKAKLSETWESLPPMFTTSSVSGKGKDEILHYIESVMQSFYRK